MKLTASQSAFLNKSGCNVLVSASAGCGKTTTMIEKIIHLLLREKIKVKELLVVTFTNAAGNEMRQKLYNRLYHTLLNEDLDEDEKNRLLDELEDVGQADIGTLHGICKKLIEKYFYAIDMDSDFIVLEDNESSYLLSTAIQRVIADYSTQQDVSFRNVFEYFNKKRKDALLSQTLITLHHFLASKPDRELWQNKILFESFSLDLENHIILDFLHQYFIEKISLLMDIVQKLHQESFVLSLQSHAENLAMICRVMNECIQTKNLFELDKIISDIDLKTLKVRNPRNPEPDVLDFLDSYNAVIGDTKSADINTVRGLIVSYQKYIQQDNGALDKLQLLKDLDEAKDIVAKLFEISNKVDQEYRVLKEKRNGLDFNDLEHYTLKILENTAIKKEIAGSYKAIFVDEYQDINEVQEQIISLLKSEENLFMIGDVKQSIYGFRHCTPKIFLEKSVEFGDDGNRNVLLNLNDNFRSHEHILSFVNLVFDKLMTRETIGVEYTKTSRLQHGSAGQVVDQTQDIELRVITSDDVDKKECIQKQAEAVLDIIIENIGKPYYHIASGTTRHLEYKDFAILTRNKGELVETIYDLLTENAIPMATSFNTNLFHTEEIGLLVSIMKVWNNHLDEESFVTLLLSVIGGFTEQELIEIRLSGSGRFLETVLSYEKDKKIIEKMSAVQTFIDTYRNKLKYQTVVDCLQDMMFEYDLWNYFGSLPDGIARTNRIKIFLKLIQNNQTMYRLDKMLDYIEMLQLKENFEVSVAGSDNSVQMLTMHKSKGLEYPFVILVGLGSKFNDETLRQELVLSNRFGVGMRSRDLVKRIEKNNVVRSACLLDKVEDERKEEIRLLYVAMTRAKNNLILVGCLKEKQKLNKSPLQCKSFMEMILLSMPKHIQSRICNGESFEFDFKGTPIVINNCTNKELSNELRVSEKPVLSTYDELLKEDIKNLCIESDRLKVDDPIVLKNTVTQLLLQGQEDYEHLVETPSEFKLSERTNVIISASDIGTAYHKVMEQVDFCFVQNAQSIVNQLVQVGSIDKDLAKQINLQKIENAEIKISQLIDEKSVLLKEAQFMYKDEHLNLVKNSKTKDKILIQGMVDLCIIRGDVGVIIDYKTNKNYSIEALKLKYQKQLELYKLAVQEAFKLKNVDCYIYSFDHEKLIKI